MNSAPAPIIATWLLKQLGSSPNNDALIGDLMEEYRRRRSRIWYWRQVLVAIVMSFCNEVRANTALALRAVAVGWAVIFLYRFLLRGAATSFYARHTYEPGQSVSNWIFQYGYWYLVYAVVLATGGWIVARLHRKHQMAMVWAFAASKVLTFLPHFLTYAVRSFNDPSYIFWASNEMWASITTTAMILLGGMWRVSPPAFESQSRRSSEYPSAAEAPRG